MKEISTKNTKNDILSAYHEALAEIEALKAKSTKQLQESHRQSGVVSRATKETQDGIISTIATIKVDISKSLDGISSKLMAQQEKLANLRGAIDIQKAELEDHYNIQTELDTMDALVLAHTRTKQQFEQDIAAKKSDWQLEKEHRDCQIKEAQELLNKNRSREKEEYEYKLKKDRKTDVDAYQLKQQKIERDLIDRKTSFDKEIAERESAVAEREAEFNRLKKESESFPTILESKVNEAIEQTTKDLNKASEYREQLQAKETCGKVSLYEQTNKSLLEKIAEQKVLIAELSKKTSYANNQVQDIALKAIEGASSNNKAFNFDKMMRKDMEMEGGR